MYIYTYTTTELLYNQLILTKSSSHRTGYICKIYTDCCNIHMYAGYLNYMMLY